MAVQVQQPIARRASFVGAAGELIIDLGLYPATKLEVFVLSSVIATFTISGSIDGVTFRDTDSIILLAPGEQAVAYDNAYRYVKIATPTVGNHTIEIAGSGS